MKHDLLPKLDGKAITVCNFEISHDDQTLSVKMTCISEDKNIYFVAFENVSNLQLSDIYYPFQISGFEIVDNSSRGYQKDMRFFVNDFEEGQISFYCESFEIYTDN